MLRTDRRARVTAQVTLCIAALAFATPVVLAFQIALRGDGIANFAEVLAQPLLPRFFLNSATIAAGCIAVVLFAATLSAYALVVLPIRWVQPLTLLLVAPLMIPAASIFLPLFINVRSLGLLNTLPSVIGPVAALSIPTMMLLIRSYLLGLPRPLIEAARVDGCNSFQVLTLILLPMMKPVMVVVTVWTFLSSWNEYFLALVFLRRPESQVVSMAPKYFMIDTMTPDLGLQFATLILISLPTLVLFIIFRNRLMHPVTSGSVK